MLTPKEIKSKRDGYVEGCAQRGVRSICEKEAVARYPIPMQLRVVESDGISYRVNPTRDGDTLEYKHKTDTRWYTYIDIIRLKLVKDLIANPLEEVSE